MIESVLIIFADVSIPTDWFLLDNVNVQDKEVIKRKWRLAIVLG